MYQACTSHVLPNCSDEVIRNICCPLHCLGLVTVQPTDSCDCTTLPEAPSDHSSIYWVSWAVNMIGSKMILTSNCACTTYSLYMLQAIYVILHYVKFRVISSNDCDHQSLGYRPQCTVQLLAILQVKQFGGTICFTATCLSCLFHDVNRTSLLRPNVERVAGVSMIHQWRLSYAARLNRN